MMMIVAKWLGKKVSDIVMGWDLFENNGFGLD